MNRFDTSPFTTFIADEELDLAMRHAVTMNQHLNDSRFRSDRYRRSDDVDSNTDDTEYDSTHVPYPAGPQLDPASVNGIVKKELVEVDPKDIGMTAELKHLYSGKENKRGRYEWTSTIPADAGVPAEDAEAQKYALIVRHIRVYNDPRRTMELHSLVVQSPLLKDFLSEVLDGYPGITTTLKRLEFDGRFEPLIHRWEVFMSALKKLEEQVNNASSSSNGQANENGESVQEAADGGEKSSEDNTKAKDAEEKTSDDKTRAEHVNEAAIKLKHAKLLHSVLVEEFHELIDSLKDMNEKGVTLFEHVWSLFHPGCHIYAKVQGQDRVLVHLSGNYTVDQDNNRIFLIIAQYIDHNGSHFGTNKLSIQINKFEGTKSIDHLVAFPFPFHPDPEAMRAKLVTRGSKMADLAGSHYRAYHGIGWRLDINGRVEKHSVRGRVVIDGYGWNQFNPIQSVTVTPLNRKPPPRSNSFGGLPATKQPLYINSYGMVGSHDVGGDEVDDGGIPMDGLFVENDEDEEKSKKKIELTDDQKLICSPCVRGYDLQEKIWLHLFVNAVHDIDFYDKAFENLVLPANQKELILGFTATQHSYCTQFDDFVEGKGKGVILLLYGPPGVGKTLTAESVAEEMRVPLYVMSASELGVDPRFVEVKLRSILDMCTRWNALLLLDEADVFLEERSLHELERNKLVSIFLRVWEYFRGIAFLTSNRFSTIDPAFQSRIHISIEYQELNIDSRRTVWENFLKQHDAAQSTASKKPVKLPASSAKSNTAALINGSRTEEELRKDAEEEHRKRTLPHNLSSKDLDSLSLMPVNGRQIKNILKTAQLLASKRGERLNKSHITKVMDVTQHLHNSTREKESTRSSIFS